MDGILDIFKEKAAEEAQSSKRATAVDQHVGHRVMIYRELSGLTQQKAAKKLGISFQQIQKYENGLNRITPTYLLGFANIFGVQVSSFFAGLPDCPETDEAVIAICEITKQNPSVSAKQVCSLYRALLKLNKKGHAFVQTRLPARTAR